jgi:hypothetical protein
MRCGSFVRLEGAVCTCHVGHWRLGTAVWTCNAALSLVFGVCCMEGVCKVSPMLCSVFGGSWQEELQKVCRCVEVPAGSGCACREPTQPQRHTC